MRNKQSESQLQSECVRWFRYQYPDLVLFAIPNGGQRNISTAARLKKEGVLPGVADLFLAKGSKWHTSENNGLFIEMKYAKGKQTELQLDFEIKIRQSGYAYAVINSFDEFKKLIERYLELK